MVGWTIDLLAKLHDLENAATKHDLLSIYLDAVLSVGNVHVTIVELNRIEDPKENFIHVGYPTEWVNFYIENNYIVSDPIIKKSRFMSHPYFWHEIRNINKSEKKIIRDVSEFGIKKGLTIPVHTHDRLIYAICFAFTDKNVDQEIELYLRALSNFFIAGYKKLDEPTDMSPPILTPREKECLRWTAKGKSSWETGMIVGVSERTVNFHINNALLKLKCTNRIMGVVRAICAGLIEL
ncbi:transcriptional activator protein LuxR [Komagataeibacter europaeus]|uniref:Transcriptional activator protein LuxR n=2 Tax=Acetobacteraceae TaxID=433 RepID=A0A0M0EHU0_KOMEU|nr:autoinducer binding domain-containing protein [Komagataeibacter europaeus]KON64815.1 transcriptional activator protein LuxR [Komagataeibacter europaeus]BAG07412.1 LuxR-like protein [Gluconacetobacter polyoxogenes]GBQ50452.1 putative two component response regulator [Komagataeibacter europaeus LMG 18890]